MGRKRVKGKYRLDSQNIALTHSDFSVDPPNLKEIVSEYIDREWKPDKWCIGMEIHPTSGRWHLHTYLYYASGFETENCDYFAIGEKRCSAQACHRGTKRVQLWINYCCKDGQYIAIGCGPQPVADLAPWSGFINKRKNKKAWAHAALWDGLQHIAWPITLFGHTLEKPDASLKCRHKIFVGDPNFGKTKALQDLFEGKKIFWCAQNPKFRFEDYEDEEIVIYDDIVPDRQEMIDVTETWRIMKRVPGEPRYDRVYWPPNVARLVIILTNNPFDLDAAWAARFEQIKL